MAIHRIPRIIWGDDLDTDLDFGFPADNARSFSTPVEGSAWTRAPSGAQDSWIVHTAYRLACDFRWIPTTDADTYPGITQTGWDGATGVRAFLEWAREKNTFLWVPDHTDPGTNIPSKLLEPMQGEPAQESDGTRRLRLVIESTDESAYTGY